MRLKDGTLVHFSYDGQPTLDQVNKFESSDEAHEFVEQFLEDIKDFKWDDAKVIKQKGWFGQKLGDLAWWYWKKKHYWRRQQ